MAKMFYTLQESMLKLDCSEGVIRMLIKEGRLREFRDGPRLMFKVDQVENIAASGIVPSPIRQQPVYPTLHLVDNRSTDLNDSDLGVSSGLIGLSDSDIGVSGSGLIDLTRESDDTALGSELLDEIIDTRRPLPTPQPHFFGTGILKAVKAEKKAEKPKSWGNLFLKGLFFVICLVMAYAAGFFTCLVMGSH